MRLLTNVKWRSPQTMESIITAKLSNFSVDEVIDLREYRSNFLTVDADHLRDNRSSDDPTPFCPINGSFFSRAAASTACFHETLAASVLFLVACISLKHVVDFSGKSAKLTASETVNGFVHKAQVSVTISVGRSLSL